MGMSNDNERYMAGVPNERELAEETKVLDWKDAVEYIRLRTGLPQKAASLLADRFEKEREEQAISKEKLGK